MVDKPTKPIETLPSSFGGVKENFSADKISTGYKKDVRDILGGANLNYWIDAQGKKFNYNDAISDYIVDMPIGKTITTDSNNKLVYQNIYDIDSETIVAKNGVVSANSNKNMFCGGIIESPNGAIINNTTSITAKSGLKFLVPNGRNADGTAKNSVFTLSADLTRTSETFSASNLHYLQSFDGGTTWSVGGRSLSNQFFISATTPTLVSDNNATWYNPVTNIVKTTSNGGTTWTDFLFCPICITYNDITQPDRPIIRFHPYNTTKFLSLYDEIITGLDKPVVTGQQVTVPMNTNYIAIDDGWVFYSAAVKAIGLDSSISVVGFVNNTAVMVCEAVCFDSNSVQSRTHAWCKVYKGDNLYLTLSANIGATVYVDNIPPACYFFPCKREYL